MWIVADVTFDSDSEAREAERLVRENKLATLSVRLADITSKLEVLDLDDDGAPADWLETITKGEIVSVTQLPVPAQGGARIEQNSDGTFTAWMVEEGVKTSDRRIIELEALTWRDPAPLTFSDREADAHETAVFVGNLANFRRTSALVATLPVAAPVEFFSDPELSTVTKPHRLEDGRYVGHGAAWGTCHLNYPGCVTPPESASNYEYARSKTVAGSELQAVPVYRHPRGDIHAPLHLDVQQTRDWYDAHCSLEGLVEVGPDLHGIWVSGAASEDIDDFYLSGDWRHAGEPETLELVAFLACKNPAFPLALVASDQQVALVAAGVVTESAPADPTLEILSLLKREVLTLRESVEPLLLDREADRLVESLAALEAFKQDAIASR